jgi:hypothetical protein
LRYRLKRTVLNNTNHMPWMLVAAEKNRLKFSFLRVRNKRNSIPNLHCTGKKQTVNLTMRLLSGQTFQGIAALCGMCAMTKEVLKISINEASIS